MPRNRKAKNISVAQNAYKAIKNDLLEIKHTEKTAEKLAKQASGEQLKAEVQPELNKARKKTEEARSYLGVSRGDGDIGAKFKESAEAFLKYVTKFVKEKLMYDAIDRKAKKYSESEVKRLQQDLNKGGKSYEYNLETFSKPGEDGEADLWVINKNRLHETTQPNFIDKAYNHIPDKHVLEDNKKALDTLEEWADERKLILQVSDKGTFALSAREYTADGGIQTRRLTTEEMQQCLTDPVHGFEARLKKAFNNDCDKHDPNLGHLKGFEPEPQKGAPGPGPTA
ncbi:MAG: hypothetical protein H2069_09360 [Legionella sp.]|nr:hypothetical protein [Legionella sp.]